MGIYCKQVTDVRSRSQGIIIKKQMDQPFEEVTAPLTENTWNDDALLDV